MTREASTGRQHVRGAATHPPTLQPRVAMRAARTEPPLYWCSLDPVQHEAASGRQWAARDTSRDSVHGAGGRAEDPRRSALGQPDVTAAAAWLPEQTRAQRVRNSEIRPDLGRGTGARYEVTEQRPSVRSHLSRRHLLHPKDLVHCRPHDPTKHIIRLHESIWPERQPLQLHPSVFKHEDRTDATSQHKLWTPFLVFAIAPLAFHDASSTSTALVSTSFASDDPAGADSSCGLIPNAGAASISSAFATVPAPVECSSGDRRLAPRRQVT
eukprot:CAMPEP_0181173858 /NCGR_PEP_ID=MMETSP1096-20121128/3224_1 /TAXON_ID=156174 ORGANISM="Chrysochromulina ericina, Strain CCMP281" /NCGR_SAMPLE_ID=MMETSP1096 /ASSEMBLY_ACC=CAM_ASM_000453 /LENGTH=268 /DNA_ID=CAMNT_0023261715 /DNA_START=290 /DNA_END=1098 /DNA_ORIENTATION=+